MYLLCAVDIAAAGVHQNPLMRSAARAAYGARGCAGAVAKPVHHMLKCIELGNMRQVVVALAAVDDYPEKPRLLCISEVYGIHQDVV